MATSDREVNSILSATGWTGATVANLNSDDDSRATDGTAGELIKADLEDTPTDFLSLNTVTLHVSARVVGTVSRQKTILVELLDSSDTQLESFTTSNLTASDVQYDSSAFTRSDSSSVIDGYRLQCTVQEGGGMGDTATVEIDHMWVTLDYTQAPTLEQKRFRFYDNDANESTATALAAENTNATVNDHAIFLIRFGIQETGAVAANGFTPELRAQKNGSGGYIRVSQYTDLRAYLSSVQTDDETVGQRLTTLTGTNVNGRLDEVDGAMTTGTNIPASGNAEFVCVLLLKRKLANNDFYDLRLYDGSGNPLDTYTVTPRVTMSRRTAELGFLEVKLTTATGANSTRTAGMASLAADSGNDIIGEDVELRMDVETPTWTPGSSEGNQTFYDYYDSVASDRSVSWHTTEFDTAGDQHIIVSEAGTAADHDQSPVGGGTDAERAQHRLVFDGNDGGGNSVSTTYKRTASLDPDTLGNGGSWGTAQGSSSVATTIATIHPATITAYVFGNRFNQGGLYYQSKMYRLMVWEGNASTGELVIDVPYFDRMYTAPEDTGDDSKWVNQGRASGLVTVQGTHVTGYDWVSSAAATSLVFNQEPIHRALLVR